MFQIHVVEDYLRVKILKIVIYKPFYKQLQNNKLSAVNVDPFLVFCVYAICACGVSIVTHAPCHSHGGPSRSC